ncbi:MAG: hypothetical protein AB1767_10420 [Bacillota bacterium]
MIKRRFVLFAALIIFVGTVGCRQEFDIDKFNKINAYVNEILPEIEEAMFDFDLWCSDLRSAEKRDWLITDANRIREINQKYLTDDFPSYEEIAGWVVPVSDGEKEWTIPGDELADVLEQMELSSTALALLINEINQADDEVFLAAKRAEIDSALTRALEASESVRKQFYR